MNLDIIKQLSILGYLLAVGIVGGVLICVSGRAANRLKITTKLCLECMLGVGLCLAFWSGIFWLDGGKIMGVYVLLGACLTWLSHRVCGKVMVKMTARKKKRNP